jgi:putative resolvase
MNAEITKYVKPKQAGDLLGIAQSTLRRMADSKQINSIRTETGRYLYDVSDYIRNRNPRPESKTRKKICYARVSGRAQKSDLENQVALLRQQFPDHEIIQDYGSGLNYNRLGFKKILDLSYRGEIQELVVTYKDRLCRFGFEMLEYLLREQSEAEIVVLNKRDTSVEAELTNDLLSILTVFSARMYGLRKYKKQIKEDKTLSQSEIQTPYEIDDRGV